VLSKRVPTLGEGIACNQDPHSLHCKALKRAKSLGAGPVSPTPVKVNCRLKYTKTLLVIGNYGNEAF
jgi:hypothetical protein